MALTGIAKRKVKKVQGKLKKASRAHANQSKILGSLLKNGSKTRNNKKKNLTKKEQARRKSFCARSAGQMKKFPKAAKDPNSRLRQARRRWRC